TTLGVVLFFVATGRLVHAVPEVVGPILARTIGDVSHVLIVIALAVVLSQWRRSRHGLRFVSILGGASLLTFLLHRVLEHALNLGLKPFEMPMEVVYAVCLAGGVFGPVLLIVLRRRVPAYDRVLRAMYL